MKAFIQEFSYFHEAAISQDFYFRMYVIGKVFVQSNGIEQLYMKFRFFLFKDTKRFTSLYSSAI